MKKLFEKLWFFNKLYKPRGNLEADKNKSQSAKRKENKIDNTAGNKRIYSVNQTLNKIHNSPPINNLYRNYIVKTQKSQSLQKLFKNPLDSFKMLWYDIKALLDAGVVQW